MPSLQEYLDTINESLAMIRLNRPAWKNRYSMGPVLTESEVVAFESRHACVLPAEYREFLLQVGDGGVGPDGLFELGEHLPGSGSPEGLDDDADLSLLFDPDKVNGVFAGEQTEDADENFKRPPAVDGTMLIGELGCGAWSRLVVTGPLAGQIWHDYGWDGGVFPHVAPDGANYRFLRWYLDWLELETYCYAHPGPMRQARSFPGTRWWQGLGT